MKEYVGNDLKVIINDDNISIVNIKKDTVKGSFMFSDITRLEWQEPANSLSGMLVIKAKKQYIIQFSSDNREEFLKLRDLVSQKSGVDFQIQTFGSQAADTFKTGLQGLFWLGLGVILMLSALQSMFGIFG
ncbi:MAG: hypothetical protein FWE24_09150 [Defluviitaleaceae bacterium]|nr:hypothetical protein [Defluviitaleaceae bacterium]